MNIQHLHQKMLFTLGVAGTIGMLWACGTDSKGLSISKLEIDGGSQEKNTVFIGSPFLLSANLSAPDTLATLEITLKSGTDGDQAILTEQYDFDPLTNVSFKEQINLPVHLDAGAYTVELSLKDKAGQRVSATSALKLAVDSSLPIVADLDIGINSKGSDLHLEAGLYAAHKLANVTVKISGQDWSDETVFNGTKLVGQVSYNFHEHLHVDLAPAGDYEVLVRITDQAGNEASATGKFTKK